MPAKTQINPSILHVLIRSRERIILECDCLSFTSNNEKGVFDILAGHANFISIIKDFIRVVKTDKTSQEIKIEGGVAQVTANNITVYLGLVPQFPTAQSAKK